LFFDKDWKTCIDAGLFAEAIMEYSVKLNIDDWPTLTAYCEAE